MIQRASEGFRYGKTDQEQRLLDAFTAMGYKAYSDQIICFSCGGISRNLTPRKYPHGCQICGLQFSEPDQFCMPDIVVISPTSETKSVVLVNGRVHDKTKQKKKDGRQIQTLRLFGYRIFVIKNDLIDNCENFWLKAIASAIFTCTNSEYIYKRLAEGEKELIGIG